ncbi:hypothetical protein MMC25_000453 [Agyrium rufum]|nr:hypothetical protein [Agyrium rufum]
MVSPSIARGRTLTRSPAPEGARVQTKSRSLSQTPRRSISPRSRTHSASPRRTLSDKGRGPNRRNGRGRSYSRSPTRTPSPGRDERRHRKRSYSRSISKEPVLRSAKIVVEKLTKNVTEAHLQEIFSAYGPIRDIDLPLNRQYNTNRGTAYIVFLDQPAAESAIAHMHEAQLDGAVITVSIVLPRRKFSRTPPPSRFNRPVAPPPTAYSSDRYSDSRYPPPGSGYRGGLPDRGPPPSYGGYNDRGAPYDNGRYRRLSPPPAYGRRARSPLPPPSRGRYNDNREGGSYRPRSRTPRSRSPRSRSPRSYNSSRSRTPIPPRRGAGRRRDSYSRDARRPSPPRRGGGGGGRRRRSPSYSSYSSYSDRSRSRSPGRGNRRR